LYILLNQLVPTGLFRPLKVENVQQFLSKVNISDHVEICFMKVPKTTQFSTPTKKSRPVVLVDE